MNFLILCFLICKGNSTAGKKPSLVFKALVLDFLVYITSLCNVTYVTYVM